MSPKDWVTITKELQNASSTLNSISALLKLGFQKQDVAIIIYGSEGLLLAPDESVSVETKELIQDALNEEEKQKNSFDPIDKELHKIQMDLLYIMVREKLTKDIERVDKRIKLERTLTTKRRNQKGE